MKVKALTRLPLILTFSRQGRRDFGNTLGRLQVVEHIADSASQGAEIADGYMTIPTGPGWGADLVEEELRRHPWRG